MRNSLVVQKYKLAKLTGKDIWGNLLLKYNDSYYSFHKYLEFRNVCNFIILEYERRSLFDFRKFHRSFKAS